MTASTSQRRPVSEWVVLALYLAMVLLGVAFHEPWRDEWRAWMISASASGPADLQQLLSGEGHPWLWYGWLRLFMGLGDASAALALAGLLAGLLGSLTFFFAVRLPLWIRAAVLFSQFWLHEYVVVSRSYGLAYALTLLAILAVVRGQRWLAAALLLGLAAHTHLLVALANLPLIALLALWGRRQPGRHRRLLAFALAIVLSVTGIAAAMGSAAAAYGQGRLARMSGRLSRVLPILPRIPPPPRRSPGRDLPPLPPGAMPPNMLARLESAAARTPGGSAGPASTPAPGVDAADVLRERVLLPYGGVGLILVVLAGLWRRCRAVVLVYSLPALTVLVLFLRFIYSGSTWHHGTVFMVLVLSLVLAREGPAASTGSASAGWLQRPWLQGWRREGPGGRLTVLALSLVLLVSVAAGLQAWGEDLRQPFSTAPNAAAQLRARGFTPERLLARTSDMEEVITIAMAPHHPAPWGPLRPLHRRKWALPATTACRQAADRARRLGQSVVIVADPRARGGRTSCPGLTTSTIRFHGLRESVELVVVEPPGPA